MIGDLLLVFGGVLGGALATWGFCRWEDNEDRQQAMRRHPTHQPDDDLPDWLNG